MQLLTEHIGERLGQGASIRVEDRDLSEYLYQIRSNSRRWAESFKPDIKFWNDSNVDNIYQQRAERIMHEPSKLKTQAELLARWKDSDRLNSVIVYMQLVEYELNRYINNLELARLKTK